MSAATTLVRAPKLRATKISWREGSAIVIYAAVVLALVGLSAALLADLFNQHSALQDSREALARLDRPGRAVLRGDTVVGPAVEARPFLPGNTVTVAGAALQARVEDSARRAGARTLSAQIDLQGPRAGDGFVGLTESLEISQPALQTLLYDLEAGMPLLFIDDLEIEAPAAFGESEGALMRVTLSVTAQWRNSP